jgi:glycerophosphoryl diester phosphodiesterase
MFKPLKLIAHRGYSSKAPENTIAAFDLALQLGYHDLEFDVQLSKDGIAMVLHDESLDRTTNGHGRLANYTYAELKQLDAGSWFHGAFRHERIPTLLELLARYKSRANLHIELKSSEPELAECVAQALQVSGWVQPHNLVARAFNRPPRLVISSFDPAQLERSINLLPITVVHELLVETITEQSLLWATQTGLRSYHPNGKDITHELVKRAAELDLHVGAWWWTREEQDVKSLKAYGVRYAFVDEPKAHRISLLTNTSSS